MRQPHIDCFYQNLGGDTIGRITIEFNEQDKEFVDRLMCAVEYSHALQELRIGSDERLTLSELEIYTGRRKVYIDGAELDLIAKEFDLLCLLVVNKGYVLTYSQIYEKVWGEDPIGTESNSVGCHIRSLRRKLFRGYPDAPFTIRCHRNIGYCLERALK